MMHAKKTEEDKFRAAVMAKPEWKAKYGSAWTDIAGAERKYETRSQRRNSFSTAPTRTWPTSPPTSLTTWLR